MDTLDTVHLPIGPTALSAVASWAPIPKSSPTSPGRDSDGRISRRRPERSTDRAAERGPRAGAGDGSHRCPTGSRGRIALWDNGDPTGSSLPFSQTRWPMETAGSSHSLPPSRNAASTMSPSVAPTTG